MTRWGEPTSARCCATKTHPRQKLSEGLSEALAFEFTTNFAAYIQPRSFMAHWTRLIATQ